MITYSCHKTLIELPMNKSAEDSTILNEKVFGKQGEIRVNESPPHSLVVPSIASQGVIHQSFFGRIGIIEHGGGQGPVESFVGLNQVLRWGIFDEAGRNV